eukprot:756582-Hanusia_phi.AAC.3
MRRRKVGYLLGFFLQLFLIRFQIVGTDISPPAASLSNNGTLAQVPTEEEVKEQGARGKKSSRGEGGGRREKSRIED